ncbi:MAG: glycosyltransferase [Acidobacteria bacterium]|nr:glycosyltransferase [Acidobacteriota bacterium]
MNPEVSVIIPAYNAEKFVAETISSVLAQSYADYEIIVVDDGSTDGTLAVLKSFEPKIKVFTKPNGGPASARNLAIRNSSGRFIAFLDCDDLWVENKLEQQVAFFKSHPEMGLVFSQAQMFIETGGEKIIRSTIGYTADPTLRQLLFGDYIPNSTVMIRRECVDSAGLLNESMDLIAVEDYEYWMRIAHSFKMAGIAKPLALYRIREGNLMGEGRDIDKGLRLSIAAISETERLFPQIWQECKVDRGELFARLHIRAGFAWKKRGKLLEACRKYLAALSCSMHPRVFRWIVAATILRHWS